MHAAVAFKQVCTNPGKTLTVMLYDNCDKCTPEQVNLQALPFKQLAPLDIGRIKIQFREVRTRLDLSCATSVQYSTVQYSTIK